MDANVLVRGCLPQGIGEAPKCTDFDDLDPNTKNQMLQSLGAIQAQWNSASYAGQMCITGIYMSCDIYFNKQIAQ